MTNKKTIGILGVMILILVVVSVIGITYAAFTQELQIEGTASAKAASWKIKFKELQEAETIGTAKEIEKPSIESGDTKISGFVAQLASPGDSISYKFKVANEGTFNAKVSSKNIPTPTCTGSGNAAATDKDNVCKHLTYTLTYATGGEINEEDTLTAGEEKELKLTLTYSASVPANELPTNDVTIGNLSTTLTYVQDGGNTAGA